LPRGVGRNLVSRYGVVACVWPRVIEGVGNGCGWILLKLFAGVVFLKVPGQVCGMIGWVGFYFFPGRVDGVCADVELSCPIRWGGSAVAVPGCFRVVWVGSEFLGRGFAGSGSVTVRC